MGAPTKNQFFIIKSIEEKRQVFGWANISIRTDGNEVIDYQEDYIEPEELEKAAYKYVLKYRTGGENHEISDVATMIESVVFTPEKIKALGLEENALPVGWWIGFQIDDPDVWEKVKSGLLRMFSIEGRAVREEFTDESA